MCRKIPEASEFRHRIMREDDLFNTRTTVFLITNGLIMTAVGISGEVSIRLVLSILGTLITIAWLMCSFQSWKVIRKLTIKYRKHDPDNYIENIVQDEMFKRRWKRPTDLMAKPLAITFLITWLVLLVFQVLKLLGQTPIK